MNTKNNIHMLEMVAKGLGKLKDDVVFVGGAVTSLYIDDHAAPPVTASDDIDCVIEVANISEYSKIEKTLAKQTSFSHSPNYFEALEKLPERFNFFVLRHYFF